MSVGNMGGRPPKPTALHLLNGNPSKIKDLDQRAELEPKAKEFTLDNLPKPPASLSKIAKKYWRENVAILAGMRLLTEADLETFGDYCKACEMCDRLYSDIKSLQTVKEPAFQSAKSGFVM